MQYLNLSLTDLESEAFVFSDPQHLGVWLCLMRYCVRRENGGRIAECRSWTDRQWLQTCGVTQASVMEDCALWAWDGDDLLPCCYPIDQERICQDRRDIGRRGGAATSAAKSEAVRENGKKGGRPRKASPAPVSAPPTDRNLSKNQSKNLTKGEGEGKRNCKDKDKDNENGSGTELLLSPPAEVEDGKPSKSVGILKKGGEPDPRHHAITSAWGPAYRAAHVREYHFSGGKDAATLKRFLTSASTVTPQAFMEQAERAWARAKTERFAPNCRKAATLHGLCTFWNEIGQELDAPANGQPKPLDLGYRGRGNGSLVPPPSVPGGF